MQIMDQFGAAPGAESVRMPDGTERTLAAEHAAAILVNEQPAFRVVCTPELLPQLALGRLLTEGWITSADEVERVAVCAQGLKISVQLRHPLAAAEQAGQEVPSCCTDNLTLASPVQLPPLAPVPQREIPAAWVDALADAMGQGLPLYRATHAVHSCLLLRAGKILYRCEDLAATTHWTNCWAAWRAQGACSKQALWCSPAVAATNWCANAPNWASVRWPPSRPLRPWACAWQN